MTPDRDLSPAEERLIDAELEQVLGRPHADLSATGATRRHHPWAWAAAILAAGLAITTATWLANRETDSDRVTPADRRATGTPDEPTTIEDGAARQDPDGPRPMPEPVRAGLGELERVDDDVENLICTLGGVSEFAKLSRFTELRKLAILPLRPPGGPADAEAAERWYWSWTLADETALGHLAGLEQLEELHLPDALSLRPAVLGPLRTLPELRRLTLCGDRARPTGELATTLASLPHLRELELQGVPVGERSLAHLRRVPLRRLELFQCPGLDGPSLAAIGEIESLESLVLGDLGGRAVRGDGQQRHRAPEPGDLGFLTRLPHLRELSLRGSTLPGSALAEFPTKLEVLDLWSVEVTPLEGLHQIGRLEALRELRVMQQREGLPLRYQFHMEGAAEFADHLAQGVRELDLRQLAYSGVLSEALAGAIGKQERLRSLSLCTQDHPDLEPLAALRELRHLSWLNTGLAVEDLAPLAGAEHLETIVFRGRTPPDREALRRVFPRDRFPDLVIRIDGQ